MPITPKLNLDPILPQVMYPQAIFVRGRVGYAYIMRQYGFVRRISKYCSPYDPKDIYVVANRTVFAQAVAYWQGFDQPTKHYYNKKIYPNVMSGYNRYIHYYLVANLPGIPVISKIMHSITFIIDGGGSAITVGEKGHIRIPFACEIQRVTLLADQAGRIKIDIWKDTYANFPPTDADTITGANEPEISSGVKDEDAVLTDWTKTINAGDILAFNVDICTTIKRVTISLKVETT